MSEHDARERFVLYRLCGCPRCGGSGQEPFDDHPDSSQNPYVKVKCDECRGEGRIRQEVASCETAEAVGVALVTLGREGEWDGCAFGLLDRMPACAECEGSGIHPKRIPGDSQGRFLVNRCTACKGSGVKPTGTWLISPWLPSARNVRDAARTLARSKKRAGSS